MKDAARDAVSAKRVSSRLPFSAPNLASITRRAPRRGLSWRAQGTGSVRHGARHAPPKQLSQERKQDLGHRPAPGAEYHVRRVIAQAEQARARVEALSTLTRFDVRKSGRE